MDKYDITKKGDDWQLDRRQLSWPAKVIVVNQQLKKQGADRAIKKSDTKEEAVQHMKDFMSDKVGSVRIHKQDGKIQEERTYQRKDDPKKSKG